MPADKGRYMKVHTRTPALTEPGCWGPAASPAPLLYAILQSPRDMTGLSILGGAAGSQFPLRGCPSLPGSPQTMGSGTGGREGLLGSEADWEKEMLSWFPESARGARMEGRRRRWGGSDRNRKEKSTQKQRERDRKKEINRKIEHGFLKAMF